MRTAGSPTCPSTPLLPLQDGEGEKGAGGVGRMRKAGLGEDGRSVGLRYCGRCRAEKGALLEGEVHGGRGEEGEERGQPEMGLGKSCSMILAPRGPPAPPHPTPELGYS